MEKEEKPKEKCLLEEAQKQLIRDHGERGRSMPVYISCHCSRCRPKY